MKVYVIEKGLYSDRHIVGVVETKEEAETICNMLRELDTYDSDSISYYGYDTKRFQTHQMRFMVSNDSDDWSVEYDDCDLYANYKTNTEVYDGYYVVYANSQQQAIKIAQDMRAEKLAKECDII